MSSIPPVSEHTWERFTNDARALLDRLDQPWTGHDVDYLIATTFALDHGTLKSEIALRMAYELGRRSGNARELLEACRRLLKFNEELCQDVNVSTHYPSADFARTAIAKAEGKR